MTHEREIPYTNPESFQMQMRNLAWSFGLPHAHVCTPSHHMLCYAMPEHSIEVRYRTAPQPHCTVAVGVCTPSHPIHAPPDPPSPCSCRPTTYHSRPQVELPELELNSLQMQMQIQLWGPPRKAIDLVVGRLTCVKHVSETKVSVSFVREAHSLPLPFHYLLPPCSALHMMYVCRRTWTNQNRERVLHSAHIQR